MSTDLAEAIRAGRWTEAGQLMSALTPPPFQGEGWGEVSSSYSLPFREGLGVGSPSEERAGWGLGVGLDELLPSGETLLQIAVEARFPAFLRRLLEAGADPNVVNADGDTPVIVSCRGDFAIETGVLLEFGADPNYISPSGWTALRCAAKDRNYAAVRILLAKGAIIPDSADQPWAAALDAFARAIAEE